MNYFGKGFMVNENFISKRDNSFFRTIDMIRKKCDWFINKHALDKFSMPFTQDGYRIKLAKNVKCYNLKGEEIEISDVMSTEVTFHFGLRMYNFINNQGQQKAGCNIYVNKIEIIQML
jgi:hypothetical protein